MVDPLTLRRWSFRALFAALALLVIFVRILPYHVGEDNWPAPDLLVLLTFAWVLRRPDYAPVWLIALTGLFADVVFVQPLGLWTLLTVLGADFLRRRHHATAGQPFPIEWLTVSLVLLAMHLGQTLILGILLVPQPPVGATGLRLLISVLAYPLVVAATAFGLGIRPASPAERDGEMRA
ncbi:rod shape-determining protein MreD [Palleronia rufa]|uniref:rod shape-determining protein MreD n=1 Tax=Palleronia rufa TaxID=1530186 RepID=UPI000565E9C3|nr:hypothetical protein [Palleronia rufa]